jgi:hypothetical protein
LLCPLLTCIITLSELSTGIHSADDAAERSRRIARLQRVEATFSSLPFGLEPHSPEYEGYMGNYGNTMDRWYHRVTIVVWTAGPGIREPGRGHAGLGSGRDSRRGRWRGPGGCSCGSGDARAVVYEFAVEPTVLPRLPDTALLLAAPDGTGTGVQPVECHPAIITLPRATTAPLGPAGAPYQASMMPPADAPHPELAPREPQQDLTQQPYEEARPAWPPQDPPAQWWKHDPRA